VFNISLYVIRHVICVASSPSGWLEWSAYWTGYAMVWLTVLVAPFLLVKWRERQTSTESRKRPTLTLLKKIGVAVVVVAALLAIGRWAAQRKFERDCEKLALWVKSIHPNPGSYRDLDLPASMRSLSADNTVDAVVLPDGRVVLMLKASIGYKGNWSGVIYASGSVTSGEIGTDPDGLSHINGLPWHFIEKQVDARHFIVTSNLG
jgi:hypothetical protein